MQFNATIKLSKNDLIDLVKKAVAKEMPGYNVKSVNFECGMSYDQFDRGPGSPVFKEVSVSVEPRRAEF